MTDCAHHHCHDHALSASKIDELIARASNHLKVQGEKLTSGRERTLRLIIEGGGPLKAYDLIAKFHPDGSAKPPTVYRALSFLEQSGLIHRIESLNAYVACLTPEDDHSAGFLICKCCGHSEEIQGLPLDMFEAKAKALNFEPQDYRMEIFGLCHSCQPSIS